MKGSVAEGDKPGGVGASGLGGVLPGIDTQFLHARDESRAVNAHAGRGPIGSPNTAIALSEGAHDRLALLLGILVGGPLPIQNPKYVMQWWGPKSFTAPFCEIDFRVGGKFLCCMRSPDGQEFWNAVVGS